MPYRWRVSKAEKFFGDAEEAFVTEMWETCVSRCYYAAYHLVAALLESRNSGIRRRWNHETLISTFEARFARRGFIFSRRDGQFLHQLLYKRYDADYNDVRFSRRDIQELFERTQALCKRLLEAIANG